MDVARHEQPPEGRRAPPAGPPGGTLRGKVALVTGAGGARLGRAIALGIASRGAAVAVHFRENAAGAREVVAAIEATGGRAAIFQADLRAPDAIRALVDDVARTLGGLEVLVHNASRFERKPFLQTTPEDWDAAWQTDLRAAALLAQAALPHLDARGAGRIVHVADVAAERPWPDYLPYCVAKAGLVALTKGLARALAPRVLVNAVALGPILMADGTTPAQLERALARVPMGRTGTPEDVVAAILFLLEGSDYVTGAIVNVDGGRATA